MSDSHFLQRQWKPQGLEDILSPDYGFDHFDPYAPTDRHGLVKIGGKLNADWVLEAYSKGIFPWYENPPIKWYSPPRRLILRPGQFKTSRSFAKFLRTHPYRIGFDSAFQQVIRSCASVRRKYFGEEEGGTWINPDIIKSYQDLYYRGIAHSVEVWREKRLVGGLYGLSLGKMFFGESMFYMEKDCSKLALYTLCRFLDQRGFLAIDCQIYSEHLESLGAVPIFKKDFLEILLLSHREPSLIGKWQSEIEGVSPQ